MFKIRQEQLEAFDASYLLRAKRRWAEYVSKRFPQLYPESNNRTLHVFVERVWETAKKYQIDKENDVATFLDLSVMYGEDFHEASWAKQILRSDWHGPDKMRILKHLVRTTGANV